MNLEPGMMIVISMILLFYLRLTVMQWGKASQLNRNRTKNGVSDPEILKLKFNWIFISTGIIIILLGVILNATPVLPDQIGTYWWILVSLGIFLFGMGIRK